MTPTSTAEMKNGRNIAAWLIFLKYLSRISLSMIAIAICRMFPRTMNARL